LIVSLVRAVILSLDRVLSRAQRVEIFTQAEGCILRVALAKSDKDLVLSDGASVRKGETIGEIHFWNERVPTMPPGGPNLAWGQRFYRQLTYSLGLLATYVENDSRFASVRAFRGETSWVPRVGALEIPKVGNHLGFDLLRLEESAGLWRRFTAFWENLYVWALIWAYNREGLVYKDILRSERCRLWISREKLARRWRKTN